MDIPVTSEMEDLHFVPLTNTIFTVQKCYLPKWFISQIKISLGSFLIIEFSQEFKVICQCFLSGQSLCEVDLSVKKLTTQNHGFLINKLLPKNSRIKSIKVESLVKLKSVDISIILNDISDVLKYKSELRQLKIILEKLLKIFVISNDSIINLNNLKEANKFGIHLVIVNKVNDNNDDKIGKITSKTKINIVKIISKSSYEKLSNKLSIKDLGGITKPYEKLLKIIKTNRNNLLKDISPNKVLISGPSDCGKTSLVKLLSEQMKIPLFTISGTNFSQSNPEETEKNLRSIFEEAEYLGKEIKDISIVLIDQIDSLCPKDISLNEALKRISYQIFCLVDQLNNNKHIFFIATTIRAKDLNPRLRFGSDKEIILTVPNQDEREEIIQIIAPSISFANSIACLTPGYVGADLELICENVFQEMFQPGFCHLMATEKDFRKVLSSMGPASLRGGLGIVLSKSKPISSLGGLNEIKKKLYQAIILPLKNSKKLNNLGLNVTKGVLLYGPPGCAKTSLAHAVASEAGCTFLAVSAADLYSPYVGEAEKRVVELFERARSALPAIIFIDEIDAIVGDRGDNNGLQGVNHRVLTAFLTEMDGIQDTCQTQTIVIGATNRPNALDPAILRPGRIDRTIFVGPPDKNDRREILSTLTRSIPLAEDVNFDLIAEKTVRYSGADLTALVQEAALISLMEKGMDSKVIESIHFEKALKTVHSSLLHSTIIDELSHMNK